LPSAAPRDEAADSKSLAKVVPTMLTGPDRGRAAPFAGPVADAGGAVTEDAAAGWAVVRPDTPKVSAAKAA
jgi:hypothetical protein